MPNRVVLGGQWGDEGKAKMVDALAEEADVIIRFQGGANAGHTVVVGPDRYAFHQIPSGILRPEKTCVLANGMVIDPLGLVEEMRALEGLGVELSGRLRVSRAAHLVMPLHRALDRAVEDAGGERSIGTTRKGIGPAYVDKAGRGGLRLSVFDLPRGGFEERVGNWWEREKGRLEARGIEVADGGEVARELAGVREAIAPLLEDTVHYLGDARERGLSLLFEGAQGSLLDLDHGTYPYVTSCNTTVGAALTGTGLPPGAIGEVIGIYKAYCTRVGNGPFPTELDGEEGELLRREGNEFGTTTGRPRRCGWFDGVAGRHAASVNGMDAVALMKLDTLGVADPVRVCTAYIIDGESTDRFPGDPERLERAEPQYRELEGWGTGVRDADRWDDLPAAAHAFVGEIESLLGVPVRWVSVGPERGRLLRRESR
jgi:adenylosuccinate synthase